MKKYKAVFPDAFTLFNLFFGFWAVISIIEDQPIRAAWLVFLASVTDALDGRIARATKLETRFGIELDSLADIVSFGLVPAVLLYANIFESLGFWALFPSFLHLSAVAIRLARFNVSTTAGPKKCYIGLTSPIASLTLISFFLLTQKVAWSFPVWAWLSLVVALSILMVSNISYDPLPNISLKESRSNTIRLLLLIFMLILLPVFREITLFPFFITYVLIGIGRAGIQLLLNTKTRLFTELEKF